jgi:hypothetical protein
MLFHQGEEMVEALACKAVLLAGGEERKQKRKPSRTRNRNQYCYGFNVWTKET